MKYGRRGTKDSGGSAARSNSKQSLLEEGKQRSESTLIIYMFDTYLSSVTRKTLCKSLYFSYLKNLPANSSCQQLFHQFIANQYELRLVGCWGMRELQITNVILGSHFYFNLHLVGQCIDRKFSVYHSVQVISLYCISSIYY